MSASGVNHGVHEPNKKYKYYHNKGHKLFGKTGNEKHFDGLDKPQAGETVVNTVINSGKWGEARIDEGAFDDVSFKMGGTRKKRKNKTKRRNKK